MARTFILFLGLGLTIATTSLGADGPSPPPAGGESGQPLSVLFLGDQGHHRPADRAAQITPVLAGRGIHVTYTEKTSDLNPETLARYDALIIYANTTRIGPAQEKALLDYVEGGGGFVPLHCASYCFLNSPKYIALVGAQFNSHGTGTFDTKIVDPSHPIMKGFEPFRTWDETYVHTKHNEKDRHVLQVRAEGQGEEPWTWVRTQGKGGSSTPPTATTDGPGTTPASTTCSSGASAGRSNKGAVADSRGRVPPVCRRSPTTRRPSTSPTICPAGNGARRATPIRRMQHPLSPEESIKHLVVPRGFEPRLFAAEPEIDKPICMTWDHRGRLWIAETVDYPNTKHPATRASDRITICEDTDGDGKADKFTVFADKLSIPTSLLFANGGVIVHQAPDTLFLKDTDGDGKADVRKVLFTGWGIGDTHAGPSNLRWGLDNWIWGIVGYSGFRGTVGGERLNRFGQAFYRFKPDGSKLEFLRSTNNNSWGVGFSEDGLVFGSTANGCPSVYLPIPNRYYESVRGWRSQVLANIARPTSSSRSPTRSGRSTGTAGSPPAPATPSTRRGPIPPSTGTRRRSSPSRPATWSPPSRSTQREATSPPTTPGTCWPATTNGPRRSRPRSAPTGTSG